VTATWSKTMWLEKVLMMRNLRKKMTSKGDGVYIYWYCSYSRSYAWPTVPYVHILFHPYLVASHSYRPVSIL
jgi:hypothetical protein